MQAILIHPLDLCQLLDTVVREGSRVEFIKDQYNSPDDLIEIYGKLYYQTTRAERISKDVE